VRAAVPAEAAAERLVGVTSNPSSVGGGSGSGVVAAVGEASARGEEARGCWEVPAARVAVYAMAQHRTAGDQVTAGVVGAAIAVAGGGYS
jgi:hypothetical protein